MPSQSAIVRVAKPVPTPWPLACAVSALIAAPLTAQDWANAASTGPAARRLHTMVYDSQRGRTVLFGGSGQGYFGDTWEWDGVIWTQVAAFGPAAVEHAMAYDSQRGRTVLFGMQSAGASVGTWEWDGSNWAQVATNGPVTRTRHAMAYDSQRGRTMLFGGQDSNGAILGDTWEWSGGAWAQVATTGPARRQHRLAYDGPRGRTVLFGGYNVTNLGDTWEWDGSTWTQVATNGPTARRSHAMAYDSVLARTVLFGGADNNGVFLGDTWLWNGSAWAQFATAHGPVPRDGHAMVYDSQRGRTVLFGGDGGGLHGDTWEWDAIPGSALGYGNGCGSPALSLAPVANARPAISATAQATLTNIPSSLAFVALGWSNTTAGPFALPFPLVWYGMPGCYMLQSCEAAAQPVTFTSPGTATYSLPLPNWAGLIGLHLYLQAWANAPGANAGNAIVSNGVEWIIGY